MVYFTHIPDGQGGNDPKKCKGCGCYLDASMGWGNFGADTFPLCANCTADVRVQTLVRQGFTALEIFNLCRLADKAPQIGGAS